MQTHVQAGTLSSDSGVVYIVYFYLIMYIAILLIDLNSYLFSGKGNILISWQVLLGIRAKNGANGNASAVFF